MQPPTAAEYQEAWTLAAERLRLERTRDALSARLATITASIERMSRAQSQRVDFSTSPQNLAGLVELVRTLKPDYARFVLLRYTLFLDYMSEPLYPGGNATSDYVALVIDEMATYSARPSVDPKHPDNKRHMQFLDDLSRLARRGRSTGLRMIVSAQEPVADQIPTTVRNNCQTTIAFRLPVDAHATAVFGQLERLPADPRDLPRGRALIKHGMTGQIQAVQFPLVYPPGGPR